MLLTCYFVLSTSFIPIPTRPTTSLLQTLPSIRVPETVLFLFVALLIPYFSHCISHITLHHTALLRYGFPHMQRRSRVKHVRYANDFRAFSFRCFSLFAFLLESGIDSAHLVMVLFLFLFLFLIAAFWFCFFFVSSLALFLHAPPAKFIIINTNAFCSIQRWT